MFHFAFIRLSLFKQIQAKLGPSSKEPMSSVVQAMNPNGRKVQIFLELRHPYQSGNKLRISITINKGSNCVHSRDPERLHRRVRCVWKPWILFASCEINLTATTYDYAVRYKFRFIYLVHIWRTYFNWCNGIFLDACQHSINEYILYEHTSHTSHPSLHGCSAFFLWRSVSVDKQICT